jgi:hypothetical protein
MREIGYLLFYVWLGSVCPLTGFSWGTEGHRAIAELSTHYVKPETLRKVNELLSANGAGSLESISTWADDLRLAARDQGPLKHNPEAAAFDRDFPKNAVWHYIDLPLGSVALETVERFGSKEDIVHAIGRCIGALESPVPSLGEITRIQALRLLVHFVGDIHQPLHCGCGFYDLSDAGRIQLITDPAAAFGKVDDRGGNGLFYDSDNNQELHAFWDIIVVTAIADTSDYRVLTQWLDQHHQKKEVPLTPDLYRTWAGHWALDSVKAAAEAYAGLQLIRLESAPGQLPIRIAINLPNDYAERSKRIASRQQYAASIHLAQLLDAIQWP